MAEPRRQVPRADAVLADPRLVAAADRLGRAQVKSAVTAGLALVREGLLRPADVTDHVVASLPARATTLQPVINATGVVLHTNLGRAPLSEAARDAVGAAAGYVDVEYDVGTGRRARRGRGTLDALLRAVPTAEAALVVNNGAAALVLATTTFARGREVVISRGEMVEIGDGFRLPDLIASTGAHLHEVGTTNRVSLDDYAAALSDRTGCILKVHPSNFQITGFTKDVTVQDLATLRAPVIVDVGSGLLAPHPLLPDEPDASSALRNGATVVTCSGDKLLGGPQAGIVLGAASAVERMRRHPLARALRIDKITLAALEATLTGPTNPTWEALMSDPESLRSRCRALAEAVGGEVVASAGAVGGGGAPGVELPGYAVALPAHFAEALRAGRPPVIARVEHGRCLIDLRCVPPRDDATVQRAVRAVAAD
jgi:L-seryl-tRNA(Ser) seleniumtransferase